jgi:heavy metal translocating P-type ATPase
MNPSAVSCDLCGLSLRHGTVKWPSEQKEFSFCCFGCRQVFIMLMEASDAPDPLQFKQSPLFKTCLEMGIIPVSESDLEAHPAKYPSETPFSLGQKATESATEDRSESSTLGIHLKVNDMWCPACAWVIEHALGKKSGIVHAACNFSTDTVRCEYNPVLTSPDRIIRTIGQLGYRAAEPEENSLAMETKKDFIRFIISAFLTANVMMLSFSLYSGFFIQLTPDTVHKLSWPIFILTSIVLFYGGPKIFRKAWGGFISAAFGMETLIAIGSLTAYVYSTVNLFSGSIHLYYDTAAMLITLTLLGKTIEKKAKDSVQKDLSIFFSLRPTKVKICSDNFPRGRYVAVEALKPGDVFVVEENEIIPADGRILDGSGTVDESSLTGEALPVQIKAGNRIRSGTRVLQGTFRARAEGIGNGSTLGQMIDIMEKALEKKIPLEAKTDRILRWFVPLVALLSIGTGWVCLLSGMSVETAMIRSVTVMVISCPCALGIAIPITRVAGISLAGHAGILVREFSAFEQAERTDTIVFDKTGTLTEGEWIIRDIVVMKPFVEKQILSMAAALEKTSDHYIAWEIRRKAQETLALPAPVEDIQCFENGMSGMLGEDEVKIGSIDFIAESLEEPSAIPAGRQKNEILQSTVYMSCGKQLCAVFVFGDRLRKTASKTVEKLQNKGYHIALVSGDGEDTTQAVGDMLGIQNAYGGRLPGDKAALVRDMQKKGKIVAMVGDGINDAPALVQSDLAIAVHSGNHLGEEAADITLMQGNPRQVLDYLNLAKQVNKKIHQNLMFSLVYNIISIPIAMGGLLTPVVAVCAMLLSSLSVTGNALLLKRNISSHEIRTR